jgi:hypothetical protein
MTDLHVASSVEIQNFTGLLTNVDPHDPHEGATLEQVNVTCVDTGALTCRLGMREVTWDN